MTVMVQSEPVLTLTEFLASSVPLEVQVKRAKHRSSKSAPPDGPWGKLLRGSSSFVVQRTKPEEPEAARSFLGSFLTCFAQPSQQSQPSLQDQGSNIMEDIGKDKYISYQTLREALEKRDTVLIKGSWLVERWRFGKSGRGAFGLPRRQELQEKFPSAIWGVEELHHLLGKGKVNIVAVSHCWLSSQHPDPQGVNLEVLCRAIDLMLRGTPLHDLAIFIDYCSLYQLPRTVEQDAAFTRANAHSHLWFLHQATRVWMLTRIPASAERGEAYGQRGWPVLERALGDMVTRENFMLDLGKLDESCTTWKRALVACKHQQRPPRLPSAFTEELRRSVFAVEADRTFAMHKYEEGFLEAIAAAKELSFSDLGWGDAEASQLAEILPHCEQLEKLALHGNRITDKGAESLIGSLHKCEVQELWLTQTTASKATKEVREKLRESWVNAGRCRDKFRL
jgi:hypothetical protein